MAEVMIPVTDYIPDGLKFRTKEPFLVYVFNGPHGLIRFVNPKEFPFLHAKATTPAEYRTFRVSEAEFLCDRDDVEPMS